MASISQPPQPTPALFFETVNAFQRTAALKAAIELDLFTAIDEKPADLQSLAARCGASARGIRILCDYLTVIGFLTKAGERYGLTPESATFLSRRSPACLGGSLEFLNSPMLTNVFQDVAAAVRKGGTVLDPEGTLSREHPIWTQFARSMGPVMVMPAEEIARLAGAEPGKKWKVLDIAAGHGLFGITIARHNSQAQIVALDWPNVLEVARELAAEAGVAGRYSTLAGSAWEADFGGGYDLVLLTNFLHHFPAETCEPLLGKVHAALQPGGRAVTLEFVPNEDRISPPRAAEFCLTMLCTTPSGDAYTFSEYERMFRNAGFSRSELHPLTSSVESVILSYR